MTTEPAHIYWRKMIRQGFSRFRPRSDEEDREFLEYLQELYEAEKRGQTTPVPGAPNLSLYTIAAGLLTFGRLDVVPDILRNLPSERHPARILARSVQALIPFDPKLDPVVDSEGALTWFEQNRSRLRWSEDEGRFRFEITG